MSLLNLIAEKVSGMERSKAASCMERFFRATRVACVIKSKLQIHCGVKFNFHRAINFNMATNATLLLSS